MQSEPQRWVRLRIIFLLGFFYLALAGVSFRTYQLQIIYSDKLRKLAQEQYLKKFPLKAPRGIIYDRNLSELATNQKGYSVFARPEKITSPAQTSKKLAQILKKTPRKIRALLQEEEKFVWVVRQISEKQGETIKALKISGIGVLPEERRYYPGGNLAGAILGFTGVDGQGLEGLEHYYDSMLRGKPCYLTVERDARGELIMFRDEQAKQSQPANLVLTIDQALQHYAEEKLKQAVKEYQAERGCLIAMEPATGKILAFALYPGFDPNNYLDYPEKRWRNWALTEVYEPGSTFKVFIVASALEEKLIKPEEKIYCEHGLYQIGDEVIHDVRKWDKLSVKEILIYSSNIGTAKIAERLGKDRLYQYILKFGFGKKTGVDFPAEAGGIVRSPKKWAPITLRTIAFGQGISVTPLQMVTALCAIANRGYLLKPYLGEKLIYSDGREKFINYPQIKRRVISEQTARILTEIMTEVVSEEGTGGLARIKGYKVAGKTGTAQKPKLDEPGYEPGKYVCSFMGFVPADNPKIAMIVVIDEPKIDYASGGKVAAPVFQEVAKYALTLMGILPQAGKEVNQLVKFNGAKKEITGKTIRPEPGRIPDFTGLSLRRAIQLAFQFGQKPILEGTGWVVEQNPAPGSPLNGKIYLKLLPGQ